MNRLYILEGADGTGKSTLAIELLEQTKGHLIHGTWKKDWDIRSYHSSMYENAIDLLKFQDVILDRWAVSEEVYSDAFRGGSRYSSDEYMMNCFNNISFENIRFIYCENDNAVENHKNNLKIRKELFNDMSPVVIAYEKYLSKTKFNWIHYDWTKCDMKEFVKELIK